jgi:hypothetical protein
MYEGYDVLKYSMNKSKYTCIFCNEKSKELPSMSVPSGRTGRISAMKSRSSSLVSFERDSDE